ncbi:UDP-N-acetylglucosamine 1-carboxyvinyltransferase [Anaerotignum sp. MB30-C6]|uniref:UDP-N-acetylglucosamine 1-carboxyvinyltransferase n=1 Tax=Anaerotignum sp. MB30-C6 TaxID=3070814 RepID=UPI0027DDEE89|nr:UDP-N-acetylglucosamine 1-carboxyvinyltransferase [Anaerotignum sp. MB30-C6]WMI80883.1 UDP-N-acetylglucosamine 1-carboxyvinyltransferase [Anaerotignum sp. MB30-C6]
MEKFVIRHTDSLQGTVRISGAKNAALPILAACLLTSEPCYIENVPPLTDVIYMLEMLKGFGAEVAYDKEKESICIHAKELTTLESSYEKADKMRASFLVAGPLISRYGQAKLPLPGGCQIGSRPVDLHLKGFHCMGAKSRQEHGVIDLTTKKLKGATIYLDFPSVGATENIMMAAVLAKGKTIIENAAAEPEIIDLAEFLREIGADIQGDGTDTVEITGVKELEGTTHSVIPDRIEAGTFMVGAAITGGDIVLENVREEHLKPVIAKLAECNVKIEAIPQGLHVYRKGKLQPLQLKTMPFPGFPTDMQAQFMSLMTLAKGTSMITETVFENRFIHAGELQRMGADIRIDSRNAVIEGVEELTGSKVRATDLRAGAALILSALAAKGETEIGEIHHIERGYYKIDEKLRALGADIERKEEV